VTWARKFDHVGARRFEDVLDLWSQRSPVGIEIGQDRLAEHIDHIAGEQELPNDGARYIGPIESRTLISELYCGVAKAFNLSFHAQTLAKNQAFTNGSLHSFNSLLQFMLAIMSILGVFVIRIGGKYFVLDVFPWLGHLKEDRRLLKQYGADWWRYARVISDSKETIEQREIVVLFQRCLRMTTAVGWKEILVSQLIDCEQRWFNRPRNNILYNFTGWTGSPDLIAALETDVSSLLRDAARSIFDYDAQTAFGSLPQSLLLGSFLTHVWTDFRGSVVMELNGQAAPEYPAVGDPALIGLIAEFEGALTAMLSESV
jgi:hypothetical protein